MNPVGVDVARLIILHSLEGFVQLDAARRKLGLAPDECTLGLETAHNLIIAYLWSQAYQQVYVIRPSVVKSNPGRFRQSGACDDQSAVALSMSVSHKTIFFDKKMPEVKFDD